MIINDNGTIREMTAEEITELEQWESEEREKQRLIPPSQIDSIEAQVLYTAMVTDSLIEEVQ